MKAIMTGVALAAVVAAAPAFAADELKQVAQANLQAEQPQATEGTTACPEGGNGTGGQDTANCAPASTGSLAAQPTPAEGDAAAQTEQPQTPAADVVAGSDAKFIGEQSSDDVLSSELVGLNVYNHADETLGDVNDIVWTKDGAIEAIIIGVGGFLGIGEKNVAVAYDAVNISTDENGDKKLVLDATADELAAAPEFTTTSQKLAMLRAQQSEQETQGAGGMTPAPAPEPAPAQ